MFNVTSIWFHLVPYDGPLFLSTSRITFNNYHLPLPPSLPALILKCCESFPGRFFVLYYCLIILYTARGKILWKKIFFTIRKILYLLLLLMLTLATFSFCFRRTWLVGGRARLYPCRSLEERACWPLYWP